MGVTLYEHNRIAYDAAAAMLAESGRAAVIHPTGTGKSFIGFQLAQDHPDATICWLSPSEYIIRTQLENLQAEGSEEIDNIRFFTYARLMLMTPPELAGIRPDYIVLDEFHRCGAEHWGEGVQALLETYPNAPVLGLSATNIRYLDNQRDMAEELFDGHVASRMTLGEAIVRGILQAPTYVISAYIYQQELEKLAERVQRNKNKAARAEAERLLEALRRALSQAEGLPEIFARHMTDRSGKYLVFCASKEHMDEMTAKAPAWFAGVDERPHIYQAYADDPETDQAFAAFKQDDSDHLKLLYCIDMLNEGVHVEDIAGVILFRPTISPIIYKQQIGRALSANKHTKPIVFDVVNNFENLYSIGTLQEEMEAAVEYYHFLGRDREIVAREFRILDEVRECRQLFEQLEKTLTATWEVMYGYAADYHAQYGDLDVPKRYRTPEGYSLGSWLQTQRRVRSGKVPGTLTDEQIRKLDDLGMVWDSQRDRSWEKHYAEAKRYREAHGDLNVPARYIADSGIALGAWINRLRFYYKNDVQQSYLTPSRILQLEELGMVWNMVDYLWYQYYAAAVDYHRQHGDLAVPAGYVTQDGRKLGNWIRRMRGIRSGTAAGRPLTPEQIALLDKLNMDWHGKTSANWERGYREAQQYFTAYGNLDVPAKYVTESGFRLGDWIRNHREGTIRITPERRAKLDALGMTWKKADPWQVRFNLARDYYEKHGNLDIPARFQVDGIWLGRWLAEQRRIYHGKTAGKHLTPKQIHDLESIAMNWTAKRGRRPKTGESA